MFFFIYLVTDFFPFFYFMSNLLSCQQLINYTNINDAIFEHLQLFRNHQSDCMLIFIGKSK